MFQAHLPWRFDISPGLWFVIMLSFHQGVWPGRISPGRGVDADGPLDRIGLLQEPVARPELQTDVSRRDMWVVRPESAPPPVAAGGGAIHARGHVGVMS